MVYLSLGSNLGDRLLYLQLAVGIIAYRVGVIKTISKVVETPSWGFDGAAFYNCCIGLETSLSPDEVLHQLLEIEELLDRKRSNQEGYQSRTIDLDILFYNDLVLESKSLNLPHPRIEERNFVLAPLAEIAPNQIHPKSNKTVLELFNSSKDHSTISKIDAEIYPVKKIKYIAIEGNIGVGKTTFARKLQHFLGGSLLLENFYENPFLEDFYRDPKTFALPVEKAFLDERIQQQNTFFRFEKPHPFIADYCMEKSLLFAEQNLDQKNYTHYREDFQKKVTSLPQPEVVFFLVQSITHLQSNIKKRGRDFEKNMSNDYLEKIEKGYNQWRKTSALPIVHFTLNGGDITTEKSVLYDFLTALFRF